MAACLQFGWCCSGWGSSHPSPPRELLLALSQRLSVPAAVDTVAWRWMFLGGGQQKASFGAIFYKMLLDRKWVKILYRYLFHNLTQTTKNACVSS